MSGSNTSVRFLGEAAVLRAVIDVACSGNRCRELLAREGRDVVVTRGTTYENRANLAPGFFDQVIRKYEGTRLGVGRCKLHGNCEPMHVYASAKHVAVALEILASDDDAGLVGLFTRGRCGIDCN